eukprot:GHVS01019093.1.p2 GENE.GHVS01019093.1~~GHVS01019093.1.p2  ORF type:complete len:158 (+),score=37.04 GHVS01019093.1:56-529(+)
MQLRRLAVVLLRKTLLAYKSALSWDACHAAKGAEQAEGTKEVKRVVGEGLIVALRAEKEEKAGLGGAICDAIEVLAGFYKAPGEWKGPWEELQILLSSEVQELAMILLDRMARVHGSAELLVDPMPIIPSLKRSLDLKQHAATRSAALKAVLSCIRE